MGAVPVRASTTELIEHMKSSRDVETLVRRLVPILERLAYLELITSGDQEHAEWRQIVAIEARQQRAQEAYQQ